MRRISTATRVVDKFGVGKDGFTNGNAVSGIPSTDVEDVWFDSVQEEIANVVEGAGVALDPSNRSQLLSVLKKMCSPVIGSRVNLKGVCTANATSITITADQIVVGTALNGQTYTLSNFNQTLTLSGTGAGKMDTGIATASSWLAIYAIYNPATGAAALLGQIFSLTASQPTVYGGANLPSGYATSALVAVVNTTATAGQFGAYSINGRRMSRINTLAFTTSTATSTPTLIGISGIVPFAAVRCRGYLVAASTSTSNVGMLISADSTGISGQNVSVSGATSQTGNYEIDIATAQTLYYTSNNSAGTPTYSVYISSFEI